MDLTDAAEAEKAKKESLILFKNYIKKRWGSETPSNRGQKNNLQVSDLISTLAVESSMNIVEVFVGDMGVNLRCRNIPKMGRTTQGVILMRFAKKTDRVAAVTTLEKNAGEKK